MINLFVHRIDAKEDLIDSEYEDDDDADVEQLNNPNKVEKAESTTKISWLLQVALENLGVTVTSYIVSLNFSAQVKIQRNLKIFFRPIETKSISCISSSTTSMLTNNINDGTTSHLDKTASTVNRSGIRKYNSR